MKQANPKSKKHLPRRKKHPLLTVDDEGLLPLPKEWVRDQRISVGDRYATWKNKSKIFLVFPKSLRRKMKIPKDAFWGKVEPGRKS